MFGRKIVYNNIVYESEGVIELLNKFGYVPSGILYDFDDPDIQEYNPEQGDFIIVEDMRNNWLIPDEYLELDIKSYILDKCENEIEVKRAEYELELFEKIGQLNILKLAKYLVDTMYDNDVIWGIGRGSSVACFCLYLIGLNLVNPIEFDIPFSEFIHIEEK